MAEHTPGPWEIVPVRSKTGANTTVLTIRNRDRELIGTEPLFADFEGVIIASVSWIIHNDASRERAEANARRIVAMLNACEGISTELLESAPPGHAREWFDAWQAAVNAAEALIARAEGRA